MELESKTKALIAVGASVSVNCQPCLHSTIAMALKRGSSEQEVTEAIEVGKRTRKAAASKMDRFASELIAALPSPVAEAADGCKCGHL